LRRLLLLLLPLLACTWTALEIQSWWNSPGPLADSTTLTVGSGSSVARVARHLNELGALERPRLWQWAVRLQGRDGDIKRGEYLLDPGVSPRLIMDLLVGGKVRHYSVTLPEGIRLSEAIKLMQQAPVLESTLSGASDERLLALVAPRESTEGLFFPDSYYYVRGDSDFDVLRAAHQRMQEQLHDAWAQKSEGLPYTTPYEALVMASIVEKETGVPSERGEIAGVFVRRLEKGMRLQTDPTVIYGLGEDFDGNLRRKHLKDASNPWNSYRHHGLPPTPIALAGRAAIDAALNPLAGKSLYFVARGDGSHQFSDTLEQHQAAVRTWQLKRVENYRSSPATKDGAP